MNTTCAIRLLAVTLTLMLLANGVSSVRSAPPVAYGDGHDPVLKWNSIALQAVAKDHSGTFGVPEQAGPTRTSRALAIVHIAIYDAVNAVLGGYDPYIPVTGIPEEARHNASLHVAVAQAAHDTLTALYPAQQEMFDDELVHVLNKVSLKKGRNEGIAVGAEAAANIMIARTADGGDTPDVPVPDEPKMIGEHRADPENPGQGLLTPLWGDVVPFVIDDVTTFNAAPPPQPDSTDALERMAYALAYDEVQRLGGDGLITPTERTSKQTEIGLFWAYDGTIGLGPPPRFYNQIARVIAWQERNTVAENARLLALVNISMADAGIASWYSKYHYNYWRPVVAIRCGNEDGNEFTVGEGDWTPLGAPATNQSNGGLNFTPPFPAYTSGHATFGAALFRTLANLYGDEHAFKLNSDELSGLTTDAGGSHRHTVVRHFEGFSQASRENADSRIYLGIHWHFDADAGITVGNAVADYVFETVLQPSP